MSITAWIPCFIQGALLILLSTQQCPSKPVSADVCCVMAGMVCKYSRVCVAWTPYQYRLATTACHPLGGSQLLGCLWMQHVPGHVLALMRSQGFSCSEKGRILLAATCSRGSTQAEKIRSCACWSSLLQQWLLQCPWLHLLSYPWSVWAGVAARELLCCMIAPSLAFCARAGFQGSEMGCPHFNHNRLAGNCPCSVKGCVQDCQHCWRVSCSCICPLPAMADGCRCLCAVHAVHHAAAEASMEACLA